MASGAKAEDRSVDRAAVAEELAQILATWGAGAVDGLRELMVELLARFEDTELERFAECLSSTGDSWGYHPPDPVARQISREMMSRVLQPGSGLNHATALEAARTGPAVFMGNHLSFVDVNVLDHLMANAGYADVVERITALVGPKVFALPIRRLASLCFGTLKLAQSASRASGEAVMSPRRVAALARRSIREARKRQARGDHLLVFPEGSRSRTGGMQRCLPGVARYLEGATLLIPFGHTGSERLMPLAEDRVYPARATARIGPPVETDRLLDACGGRRGLAMDAVGCLIAAQLPAPYRGAYGETPDELLQAREIARELAG